MDSRRRAEVARSPPLIAITAYGQARGLEARFQAGFYGHRTKPADVDKLVPLFDSLPGGAPVPLASATQAAQGG